MWNAHRDPALVAQWLGPRGYEMDIERWDFVTGGGYRYVHRDGAGSEFGFHGTFHAIREDDLAVQTFEYEGARTRSPWSSCASRTSAAAGPGCAAAASARPSRAATRMVASGMEHGMAEGYERLDEVLAAG